MKTILALLLVFTGLTLTAAPTFLPLPGTPEGDALEAAPATLTVTNLSVAQPKAAASAPAVKTAPVITDAETPMAPLGNVPSAPMAAAANNNAPIHRPPQPLSGVPPLAPPVNNVNPNPVVNPVASAPAPVVSAPAPAAPANPKPPEEMIGVSALRFQNAPLEQVLDFYAIMVNRTMLRPASLPAASITIKAQTELTKSEALQALDSVLGLNGIVMIPVGTKFIKVVPEAQANKEAGVINTNDADALPELGTYVTHVVQLRYTKPSELMTILTPFSKMAGTLQAIDGNGILILRDYTENVKRMLELIDQIDVSVPSEIVSEVIPIKYALASDIASALNSVGGASAGAVGGGSGAATGAGAGVTGRRGLGTGGPQTIGSPMTGNTAGGIPVNRYGSSTAAGAGGTAGGQPQTFQQRLQNIIQKASTGGGGDFQLIGPNKIIPDERTNSLLVFASRGDMEMIKAIINKLDVVLAQVLIEAIILDVTLGDNLNYGVSAGQQPKALIGGNPNIVGGGSANDANALNTGIGFLSGLLQGSITNSGSTNGISIAKAFPSSSGGLSYFGNIGPTWNVALSALAGNNNVKVLARPSIQTSHAVPAQIFVGETRPYITGTYYNGYSGGGSQSQYQQSQIGISLNVTPLINPDGLVVMDIQQQVQQVGGSVTIDGNSVPITQDQNASSKVAVKDGETIVMGGFIQNQKSESKSGIPILQDIPLFGALFRSTSTTGNRRELLVMIRPTVLKTPEVAALNTQIQMDRHPTLKEANADFQKAENKLLKHANKVVKPDTAFKSVSATGEPPAAADQTDDKQ